MLYCSCRVSQGSCYRHSTRHVNRTRLCRLVFHISVLVCGSIRLSFRSLVCVLLWMYSTKPQKCYMTKKVWRAPKYCPQINNTSCYLPQWGNHLSPLCFCFFFIVFTVTFLPFFQLILHLKTNINIAGIAKDGPRYQHTGSVVEGKDSL